MRPRPSPHDVPRRNGTRSGGFRNPSISADFHCTFAFWHDELIVQLGLSRGGVEINTFILRTRQDSQATLTDFLTGRLPVTSVLVLGMDAVDVVEGVGVEVGVDADVVLSSTKDWISPDEFARSDESRRCLLGGEELTCIVKGIKKGERRDDSGNLEDKSPPCQRTCSCREEEGRDDLCLI